MAIYSQSLILVAFTLFGSNTITSVAISIRESTVHDFQISFKKNQLTSRQLVEFYLGEIHKLNPVLKGVIEVNPDALYEADKADQERKANAAGSLPRLHGIPVLLKDLIGTKDKLNTTAGSFALLGSVVPQDAAVVVKLRKAGAIILGKASLSEWTKFRSLAAPNGWSARGNQGKEMLKEFGQVVFLVAEATNGIGDAENTALLNLERLSRDGFVKLMRDNKLDALVTPSPGCALLAIGGFPGISVLAAYDSNGVPVGICFGGLKGYEPKLIEIAYGFEQATKIRRPPTFQP